jgi:hypothetical protein
LKLSRTLKLAQSASLRMNALLAGCLSGMALLLFVPAIGSAQESSSRPDNNAAVASGPVSALQQPAAALRDALSAACSENEKEFARFMTQRNAGSFGQMTPAARVALMKRFVLLNEPGRASVETNLSGRPTVRCQTPAGAADLQIGGPDIRDNLAFLPVEVRDVTDTADTDVMHVQMGLVRESGEWKLLSVGLVLLDLPSLEVEWDTAEIDTNEKAAIESLKKIADSVEAYRRAYLRLPESLNALGMPAKASAGTETPHPLEAGLASGVKNGYTFRYVIVGASSLGAPAKYELAATPLHYERTGRRSFLRDTNGQLHGANHQGAIGVEADPKAE